MKSVDIVFRKAERSDDISAIARYIHLTDPYIYPCICESEKDEFWISIVKQCVESKTNLFSFDNIYLAVCGGKTVGVACVIKCGEKKTFFEDLELTYGKREKLRLANDGYFIPLIEESAELDGYNITNICIAPEFRGRGIGEGLLRFCIEECKGATVHLDVIADNIGALELYKKCGFEIEKSYYGFSGTDKELECYHMRRK